MEKARTEESWFDHARCLGMDPNAFVPTGPGGSMKRVYAICNGTKENPPCPVRDECGKYARDTGSVGVFGGRMFALRAVPVQVVPVEVFVDFRPRVVD